MKRNIIWLLFILSCLIGIPGIILVNYSIVAEENLDLIGVEFSQVIAIGNIFSTEMRFNDTFFVYSEVIKYLCMVGVIYLLVHSVYIRKFMLKMGNDLDTEAITAQDFSIIARHLPNNLSKD